MERVREVGAPLCIGLDPYVGHIPAIFGPGLAGAKGFCREIVDLACAHGAALKPQCALFEAMGWEGVRLLHALIAQARGKGLPVILDAKRGDIGATAAGYATACLGPAPGMDADAVTVSPYMGKDSLEPFLALAQQNAKGVAVLARTSNPGASDVQGLICHDQPVWAHVANMLAPHTERLLGESGWSGLMVVAGATAPAEAMRLRHLLPKALFLVPGYGTQGASAAQAVAGFVRTPRGLEGGIVNASRALLFPEAAQAARTLADWRTAIQARMQAARAELAQACA